MIVVILLLTLLICVSGFIIIDVLDQQQRHINLLRQ